MMFNELTIVTSSRRYGRYLPEWAKSIMMQRVKPRAVCIFTHGQDNDDVIAKRVIGQLRAVNIDARHEHDENALDFGVARNRAVAMSKTEWVMHLDADDLLLPHAVAMFTPLAPDADVISAGYIISGKVTAGLTTKRERVYQPADGLRALDLRAICSGVSPFRRSFWERSPYRTDMLGAWDTALWLGFARLGARFRPTPRAVFIYRQHDDSIFNKRKVGVTWPRALTTAQLKGLRRNYNGVAILVPRDVSATSDRELVWQRVKKHYEHHHPEWPIIVGTSPAGVWSKGDAIANALGKTSAELLIIADADCLVDPGALRSTVEHVAIGAPWGMPHHMVYRATHAMTERYCAESADTIPVLPDSHSSSREPYEGAPGGGIVVIRRVHYEAFGGIPRAMQGWGSEDRALAHLANHLIGPCTRGDADLLHLFHEPQSQEQSGPNLQILRKLGFAASKGKDALLQEALMLPNAMSVLSLAPLRHSRMVKPVPLRDATSRQALIARQKRRRSQ